MNSTQQDSTRRVRIKAWKESLKEVHAKAREISEKHGGCSPDVLHDDYTEWNNLCGQHRYLRDLIDTNTEAHEWYLRD